MGAGGVQAVHGHWRCVGSHADGTTGRAVDVRTPAPVNRRVLLPAWVRAPAGIHAQGLDVGVAAC